MLIFQFTLPREERRQVQAQPLTLQNFNPRSHERSDHITQSFVFRFFNFNPRSHERSDPKGHGIRRGYEISIHAPTRGATIPIGLKSFNDLISIHAPTRGATLTCLEQLQIIRAFQSTLPREERRQDGGEREYTMNFNPRSHERSDPVLSSVPLGSVPISIHAPTRGATCFHFVKLLWGLFQSTLPREERHN